MAIRKIEGVERENGKRRTTYQVDVLYNGKRIRKNFKKLKDARGEEGKYTALKAENRSILDLKKESQTTLKELTDLYEANFSHQSIWKGGKKRYVEKFLEVFGDETKLDKIRYVDLETYRNKLRQSITVRGRLPSDASVNREMSALHHLFDKAVEWELIGVSPFDRGKTFFLKENNKRLRFLSKEEIDRLLAECPTHLKRVVQCALLSGMRRGEILSLKWSQIRNGFIYLQETKTNESREIPINDDLIQMFKEIRREQQFKSEFVFTYVAGSDKVLHGKRSDCDKEPKRLVQVRTAFKSAVRRAGIEDFRFHDLRHTFASHLIMNGASLKSVQELLGHKTMDMTMRYSHLSQEHKQNSINLLSGLTTASDSSSHKRVTNLKPDL